jgi:ketosteroid isomerase-like protein
MRSTLITVASGLAVALSLAGCGGSSGSSATDAATQRQANMWQIDEIEKTWHKAASTQNVDLMMSLWAPDATFTQGPVTISGKADIRKFFGTAGPFQPGNTWVSDTAAYKIRITVSDDGSRGTLYFECHYIDPKTGKVMATVGADQNVEKIGGKWLITKTVAATPSSPAVAKS